MAGTTVTGEVRLLSGEPPAQRRQGRYVLGELLGRGGMAEVFAGHAMGSHGFQKPVAIKRLLPELANDHMFVDRLIGEAKLLVGMQHGNVVSVLDLARDGDDVFLVMEFVDGPSLRGLIKARHPRPLVSNRQRAGRRNRFGRTLVPFHPSNSRTCTYVRGPVP